MNGNLKLAGIVACACAALGLAPAAMASGGKPPAAGGGVVATGGGAAAGGAAAGGGSAGGGSAGGGGGGGAARGTGVDPTPPPPPPPPPPPAPAAVPCGALTAASATVGHYLAGAAVWNNFTIWNCAAGTESVNVEAIETDAISGQVAYDVTTSYGMGIGQSIQGVLDNDFAPFATTYTVTYNLTDASGNLLDTKSTSATTPAN